MKDALLSQLDNAYACFRRSTGSLSEEDSSFTPVDGTFTAAGQVAHVAQTIDWFIEGAFSPTGFDLDFPTHEKAIRAVTSLAEANAWVQRAVENARHAIESRSEEEWAAPIADGPVMGGLPRFTIFNGITDHTAHHRGALTMYARALGKTPPNPYVD
jgi:uncharacterized damage-inducible protein DinB